MWSRNMYEFVRKVEKLVLKEAGSLGSCLNLKTTKKKCGSECKQTCSGKQCLSCKQDKEIKNGKE